jgi:hypothetical protein
MLTWEFPRSCPVRDSHAGGPVLAKELVSPGKLSPVLDLSDADESHPAPKSKETYFRVRYCDAVYEWT